MFRTYHNSIPPSVQRRFLLLLGLCILGSCMFLSRRTASVSAAMSTSSACSNEKAATLIFLHGLGDTPAGWSSLRYSLPAIRPSLRHLTFVFPPAPVIPISINGNSRMPGWFDLYDWPIGLEARDDRHGLERSVRQVREVVGKLEAESGIPKNRIVLGGFSQGGAVAMLAAYTALGDTDQNDAGSSSTPYAGCIALSGWLPLRDGLAVSPGAQHTPLLWAHGTYDDKVLFEHQASGVEVLKEKGVESVRHSQYAMGHSSTQEELEAMAEFLDSVLFAQQSC